MNGRSNFDHVSASAALAILVQFIVTPETMTTDRINHVGALLEDTGRYDLAYLIKTYTVIQIPPRLIMGGRPMDIIDTINLRMGEQCANKYYKDRADGVERIPLLIVEEK